MMSFYWVDCTVKIIDQQKNHTALQVLIMTYELLSINCILFIPIKQPANHIQREFSFIYKLNK